MYVSQWLLEYLMRVNLINEAEYVSMSKDIDTGSYLVDDVPYYASTLTLFILFILF